MPSENLKSQIWNLHFIRQSAFGNRQSPPPPVHSRAEAYHLPFAQFRRTPGPTTTTTERNCRMGPTNLALVKLFQVDQQLREAQARLDAATRDVRIQERKLNDLVERQKLAQTKLREAQVHSGNLELDLKTRDAHIEKLRNQQQLAHTNKEYQAFLIEINTAKVDRNKVEEETIRSMEQVERLQGEVKDL